MAEARLLTLLEEQREWLSASEVAARRAAEDLLEQSRQEMLERMARALEGLGEDAWTTQLMRASLVQVDAALAQLREGLEADLSARIAEAAAAGGEGVLAQVRLMEGGISLPMRLDLATRIQEGSRLRLPGVLERYGSDVALAIERQLGVMILARTPRHLAAARILAVADEALQGSVFRARLIYRNELAAAYDAGTAERLDELARSLEARGSEPLLSRMDEALDRRSHPFSWAAHGTVAGAGEPWRVPAAEVAARGAAMKVRATGMLWREEGGAWVGSTYPAHHNDRGRRTAWRRSWGDPKET